MQFSLPILTALLLISQEVVAMPVNIKRANEISAENSNTGSAVAGTIVNTAGSAVSGGSGAAADNSKAETAKTDSKTMTTEAETAKVNPKTVATEPIASDSTAAKTGLLESVKNGWQKLGKLGKFGVVAGGAAAAVYAGDKVYGWVKDKHSVNGTTTASASVTHVAQTVIATPVVTKAA
ncbi:hypothetical protein DASC09_057190 [Saccharomycopsis crataegensis]|uniref:RxLR effector protein n=1 Tax=Saccharomycopsis crataegensis TaxID=43959 RepID=A0AAV5QTW6_9ASCO|nr:hypothetical protein DASC09_057190 [Saccharomycopsis crataegensis]